jgi:hypothetical protein
MYVFDAPLTRLHIYMLLLPFLMGWDTPSSQTSTTEPPTTQGDRQECDDSGSVGRIEVPV